MVTGNSTADLTIVLVDARKGIVEQTRRHAFLASLLRVPHLLVCVNKMDLVDYDQEVFDAIREEFTAFASRLDVADLTFIPISALQGDNVVQRSANMPWYEGASLLHHLEQVYIASDRNLIDPRLPGPVGGPAPGHQPPRLPGLRRPGGRRGVPARRRGDGAPVGPDHHRGRHRHLRRAASRRPSPRCRSPCGWPTTSTSPGAT